MNNLLTFPKISHHSWKALITGFVLVASASLLHGVDDPRLDPSYVFQPATPGNVPYQPTPVLQGGLVIPIYPPDSVFLDQKRIKEPEKYKMANGVPGRIQNVINVHNPSIEWHPVEPGRNTGAAIILIPGGGHRNLGVTGGGADFIPYFFNYGVNTILLRYRLRNDGYNAEVDAVNDTLQAIRLVRSHAKEWKLDPNKIGVMGFSAGAEPGSAAALYFEKFDRENNSKNDPLAGVSSRPDFVSLIYPGPTPFRDNPNVAIPKNVPPAFIACAASGDAVHAIWANEYFSAMLNKKVPNIEMHLYANGNHGGGISNRGGIPFGTWHERYTDWFRDLGFLAKPGVPTKAAADLMAYLKSE
jgi:hypothetical protein